MTANTPPRSVLRPRPSRRLLRPLLTSRSGPTPSPFQAQGEISPGKNALLHCTTAGSTPLPLGHDSFAVHGPLALVRSASYPVLVHRPTASLHASSPHSVALVQLRFASLVVTNSRWDLHPQECAHAGRTTKKGPRTHGPSFGRKRPRSTANPRAETLRVAPHKGDVVVSSIDFKQQFGQAYPKWGEFADCTDSRPLTN